MRYRVAPAGAGLDDLLECLWFLDGDGGEMPSQRVLPDGCPELIFHLGDVWSRRGDDGVFRPQPRAFLAGLLTRPLHLEPARRASVVGVRFRLAGLHGFVSTPLHRLADRDTPIEDLWGADGEALADEIARRPDDDARAEAARAFLVARRTPPDPDAVRAVGLLLEERGRLRTRALAERLGTSERRLERLFRARLGATPKTISRIVRLQEVLRLRAGAPGLDGASLAALAGFADQSHLVREFRGLTGATPSRPAGPDARLGANWEGPDRLEALFGA